MGGGSKAVWNFSENSSNLVAPLFPKSGVEIKQQSCILHRYINSNIDRSDGF